MKRSQIPACSTVSRKMPFDTAGPITTMTATSIFTSERRGTATGSTSCGQTNGGTSLTLMPNTGATPNVVQPYEGTVSWADYNNDGWADLFLPRWNDLKNRLFRNNGNGTFNEVTVGAIVNDLAWTSGGFWGDYDNDGDLDLVTLGFWNTDSRFWENDGQGNLNDASANHPNIFPTATSGSNSNGVVWVDYNRDGWLDLHITQPDLLPDRFFENEKTSCRSWLEIKCIGVASNRAAIGATLRAKAQVGGSAVWQMRQVSAQTAATGNNPLLQHFGFDDAAQVDSLVVEWPSGNTCVFTQVAVNQIIDIQEDCSIKVTQSPPPFPGTSQTVTLCQPAIDTLQLQPNSPAGGTWTASCGTCISNEGIFDPQNLAAGEYFVRYVQGGICSGTADTFLIQLRMPPSIVLSGDTTVYVGEEVPLLVSGAQNYQWLPVENLSCADCFDPIFTADTTTVFSVTGQDAFGCAATDSVTVTVLPDLEFSMPNAFTPNGDGSNDLFMPAFKGDIFEKFHLRVFTRWGELIFESKSPNQGWNGMMKDVALPSDVYVYVFEYGLTDGSLGQKKGDVTLLR